ncbi:Coronin-6, putative [Pediculus humanus corporis]|uniref:Coronin n=1 Tax=Pediculus humanus subsp. corporis TaxID=121224 RepID=E0VK18_PEDHC|nr:Coronin-6, putative [Pediculus humanus corporis]EEB13724.1 Coronin-6, putative [Pediculus humanus corporis]
MSFRVVRSSKFRHVYGSALKREQCYDNIRVSKSSWDSTFCCVNPKFLAIIVESAGGGAFIVLPLNKVGRIAADYPLVGGHKGPVLDIAWCPHNDNVIASGSEDCVVKVWQIPDNGLSRTLTEPVVDLIYHQRRVGLVLWHPTAKNVLLTAGSDNQVLIWNVGTGEVLVEIDCHPDIVYSACWNWDGSQLLTTCKDKKIRLINPRTGAVEEEAVSHEGSKAARAIFLKSGLIFTTGFSKMSERQYSLRAPEHLNEPIVMVELDTSNGVMFPLYDVDTNLVYLCGKADLFHEDLYPDTLGDEPAITAEEWIGGTDAEPILISLKNCSVAPSSKKSELTVTKKTNVLDKVPPKAPKSSHQSSGVSDDVIKQFQEEIRKLKAIIVKHENRIRALEARLPAQSNEEDDNNGSSNKTSGKMKTNDNEQESELGPDEV